MSGTTTKYKLKSSWNWKFDCERKKSTKDKLHKIWNSNYFCKKTAKRAHPWKLHKIEKNWTGRALKFYNIDPHTGTSMVNAEISQGCARFPDFTQNFSEHQILWSLCSVDFHTLTLQLPIQTPHSLAPELQVFVSSLENCQHFRKTSTPLLIQLQPLICRENHWEFCRILLKFSRQYKNSLEIH